MVTKSLTEYSDPPTLETHRLSGRTTTMTVTLKPKTEITVPKSIRRQAGFKPGDRVEFQVSDRSITIVPKLTPDEIQDEREMRDPKIRAAIRKSHEEFLAGKSRPIQELFSERAARTTGRKRRRA
jgi:AbrB family looped-hinge helix DNA binding protein